MASSIEFEVGDLVEFGLNPRGDGPRWECNTDQGFSKKSVDGVVVSVDPHRITVLAILPAKGMAPRHVNFPNTQSTDYDPDQWIWPGYLKKNKIYKPPSCDCGNGNDSGTHYQFCSRRKYIESRGNR